MQEKDHTSSPVIPGSDPESIQTVPNSPPSSTPPVIPGSDPESIPSSVPNIDPNASLKIESVQTLEEELPQEEKRGKLFFVLGSILGLLVISGALILGLFLFRLPAQQATAPEAAPTPQPSQTPAPILKNVDITFEVLNSTKTSGLAAKYGKQLEAKGYKVNLLGNSSETITGVAVYLAGSLLTQKDLLMSDLQKEFPQATYSGTLSDSPNLVRLIIGD